MNQSMFDAIARKLGAAVNRRAGLRAAASLAAVSAGGRGRLMDADAHGPARRKAATEKRPCGGSPKDNRCEKDSDCCTNYCKAGKDGKTGRCRCVKPGDPCRKAQTCCGGSVCRNRTCQPDCTVCASGCQFNSVNAAYAAAAPGAVITIDRGTYATEILVTKDVTLKACAGQPDVLLVPARLTTIGPDSYYPVIAEDQTDTQAHHAVTLDGLGLGGNVGRDDEVMISSYVNETVSWTVRGCTVSGASQGMWTSNGVHVLENSTFSDCGYPTCFYMYDPAASVSISGCAFTNNAVSGVISDGGVTTITGSTITGNRDGGVGVYDGDLTLIDTRVSGNSSANWGGGVWGYSGFDGVSDASITLGGATVITGNSAPEASGLGIRQDSSTTVAVTGASSANVYGNLAGEQCERSPDGFVWTPVANCAF